MSHLRSILTYLAIASLLVSDVVVMVHSASCSPGLGSLVSANVELHSAQQSTQLQPTTLTSGQPAPEKTVAVKRVGELKVCGCGHHCNATRPSSTEDSPTATPEHDCDECTICQGALLCRFAVICDAVLPPEFEELADWVTATTASPSLGQEFSSALSERGPPA